MRTILLILALVYIANFGLEGFVNKSAESVCQLAMTAEKLNSSGTGGHGKICKDLKIVVD